MSINLRKVEAQAIAKTHKKHGIYAFLASGKLPSGRGWKRTQAEVSKIRTALIEQYGGDNIKPAVLALVESAIEGLMIQRLAGLYVKRAGILRADSLAKGNFELHSILAGQFISYANLVRLNLEAAARLAGQKLPDLPAPTLAEIIRECDEEEAKAREAAESAPESAAAPVEGKGEEAADPGDIGQGAAERASRITQEGRSPDDEGQEDGNDDK